MVKEIVGEYRGDGIKLAIVVSRFNETITRRLLSGALEGLRFCGTEEESISVIWVPGSLELGLVAKALAESKDYDALICLGSVIQGETSHYDVVVSRGTSALSKVALDTGVPIAMGMLTTYNLEQAMARSGEKLSNKGYEAALTAVEMASLMSLIHKKGMR